MTIELLVELAWKSTFCAGAALLLITVLERRSAAEKSLIAYLAVLALVLLPVFVALLPNLAIQTPVLISAAAQTVPTATEVAAPFTGTAAAPSSIAPVDWSQAVIIAYSGVALLLLGGLAAALLRLRQIRSRAQLLSEPRWLLALVAAQRRVGCKNGTALLVSSELDSPVSWGLLRPTIIVDSAAAAAVDQAEAIISHELAHVIRLDWLRLVLGRVAVALFWFNPLVWMLVRRSHQLAEEAADDAVLRTNIPCSDYADLLLHSVRHAQRSTLLAANGVAPSRSSLSQRIGHVLDGTRSRHSVRFGWAATSLAVAASFNAVLAAATPAATAPLTAAVDPSAGEQAAPSLEQLRTPQARAIGRAIRLRSWEARRSIGSTLFNEPAAIPPLLRALTDDEAEVRAIAIWGLSEMRPDPGAEAALRIAPLLTDPSPRVRMQAVRALGEFGGAAHADRSAALLADPVADVRIAAAHALGDLQLPQTRGALEAARSDPDPAVRAKVDWALRQVAEAERILRRASG